MLLNAAEWRALAEELSALEGSVIQKLQVPREMLCYLELRQPGRSIGLTVSAEPNIARLSITQQRIESPLQALSFQQRLRKLIGGAKWTQVIAHASGAIIALEKKDERFQLVIEGGNGKNRLLLLDGNGKLLALSGQRGPDAKIGQPYVLESRPGGESVVNRLAPISNEEPFPLAQAAEQKALSTHQERGTKDQLKSRLSPLKAKRARLERTIAKVEEEAARGERAEKHRVLGERLSQNLHRIARGAKSVSVPVYLETGEHWETIELDPSRPPKEQAEWNFHQYRRLLRGAEIARQRVEKLRAELAQLDARIAQESVAPLGEDSTGPAPLPEPPRKKRNPVASPFKEFHTSRGERIWVGKNAIGNDALTFQIAQPHHLWLHARGVPGSHVIVPLEKNQACPTDLLLDAAHLAAHHSDAKGENRVEVSYTPVKFVKKVKGGMPGQVIYSREKTILVRVEKERLARLATSQGSTQN